MTELQQKKAAAKKMQAQKKRAEAKALAATAQTQRLRKLAQAKEAASAVIHEEKSFDLAVARRHIARSL